MICPLVAAYQGSVAADDYPIGPIPVNGRVVSFRAANGVTATGDNTVNLKLQKATTDLLSSDLVLSAGSPAAKASSTGTLKTDTTVDVVKGDVLTVVATLGGSTGAYPVDLSLTVRIEVGDGV